MNVSTTEPAEQLAGPTHPLCPHDSCWQIKLAAAGPARARYSIERIDAALVRFLARNVDRIRQDSDAAAIARSIHRLATRVERVIDNHQPDMYCGPCDGPVADTAVVDGTVQITIREGEECGADLFAQIGDRWVTCTVCGKRHPTTELQRWLLDQARNEWMRPRAIVDVLRARGEDITLDRLKNWISRDKAEADAARRRRVPYPPILQVGSEPKVDAAGQPVMEPMLDDNGQPKQDENRRPIMVQATRPLFRLGDVIDRLAALAAIDQARREGTGA